MATTTTSAPAAATTGDPLGGGCDSGCSTPFVSAPSSPSRDHHLLPYPHGACFYSAPASPTRGGGAGGGLDFDFSSRFPSPSAAAMSSADELFCNGQIRPVRLAAALLQPQPPAPQILAAEADDDAADERGRAHSRPVRRKARSMSPFGSHWRRPPPNEPAAVPAASRSSSSSSASSTSSSSSSRGSRRWGFLKDLLHRSKSDGGKTHHHAPTPPSPSAQKASPFPASSPAAAGKARPTPTTGRSRRRSAHERLYEARRAEAEEMRRRTYLPYRQGVLLFGCIGLGSRGYGAVSGLARGLHAAVSSRS